MKNNFSLNLGLLILRVVAGAFMLAAHGWPKLMKFETSFHKFANPIGLGSEASYILVVFAEVLCAFLVIIGWFGRFAAIPLVINMAVAGYIVHGNDAWNKQEFAYLYGVIFLALVFTGMGKFSIDGGKR
jgi:putative oxidoreductase